ncbi:MAG: DUF2306 domain-containing protein [Myxococcota bacterium]
MEQLRKRESSRSKITLKVSTITWFVVTVLGQWAFVVYILAYYGARTLNGDWTAWNDRPLIDGHQAGDTWGNLGFLLHTLLAAIMTAAGTVQLLPAVRARWPRLHRIGGRAFLATAAILAISGLALVWIRGTYLNVVAAVAVSVDAILILVFSALALQTAVRHRFLEHRRWALRTFMVANGVWMLRIGYMAWAIPTGGLGVSNSMDGPFDTFWVFGCYLLPLAILETYLWVESNGNSAQRWGVAGLLFASAACIALGVFGTAMFRWLPYL